MEFFNELKEDLEKLRERRNDLIWDDAQLQEQRERYSEAKAEFDDKYRDIGDNPFKQEERGREETPLMQQEQKLIDGEQELKRKKNQLSADFKDFVTENREWINEEKKRIKARMENPINIEELKDRKASLETDRARYEERVQGWENNNINPNDQIYVRLKQTLIPEIDAEIADIDKQMAEYRTNEEMSEDWDKLNEINGIFNKCVFESYEMDKLDDEIANLTNLLEGKEEQTEELMQESEQQTEEQTKEPEQQEPSMPQPQPQAQIRTQIQPQTQPQAQVKPQSQEQSQTNSKIEYANQIKEIEVGTKGITITFKGKTASQPITVPLKEVKDAYERKSEILKQNGITKGIEGIDPAIIQAFQSAKLAQGVSRDGIKRIQDLYMKSFEDNSEKSELLQGLITYNRSGLDYLKPSNIFKFIMNRKEYKQMREYANIAGKKEIATVVPDKKGPIRSFFDNRVKQLGNNNRDITALPESQENRNNYNDKGLRQELKVDYRGACENAENKKNRAMGIDDPSGKLEQNSEQASTVAQEQDDEER